VAIDVKVAAVGRKESRQVSGYYVIITACATFLLILHLVFLLALIVLTESIYHPMRCNPETTPPWESIAAALDQGPEMDPRSRSRFGRAGGVGQGRVRVGEHGGARVRPLTWGG
jgi:hypothetical protein